MAINLLDMLKDQMTSSVVDQISNVVGESSASTGSAISKMLPTILGGVINKGGTESGAGRLLNMIADGNYDGSIFNNLGNMLGNGEATSGLMKTGSSLLSGLLGNNLSSIMDVVTKATGMGRNSSSSLMNMLAPMVMGMVGRHVKNKGLSASGLMNMLLGQKEHVANALPAGMGNILGFSTSTGGTRATATSNSNSNSSGGGGWMKWLVLGLLALLGLGYFGMRTGCAAVDNTASTVSNTTGNLVDGAGNMIKSAAGYTKDAAGNLVDKTGNVIAKAGEFTVDAAGNIVDGTGKMIDKAANSISSAFNYTKDATGNLVNEAGEVVYKAGEYSMDAAGNIVDASGKILESANTKASDAAAATGAAVENAANAATGTLSSSMTLVEDASGNLVDKAGNIVAKKGEWSKDKDGNFLNKAGKAISGAAKKVGGAVSDAASATGGAIADGATAFKNKFTGMFKKAEEAKVAGGATADDAKKQGGKIGGAINKVTGKGKEAVSGAVSGTIKYTLTDIVFKDNSARIETFTKAEVEGLADALKSYPKANITVQTLGKDKSLSGQRATAVHDMLVALGVDKKQISHKGVKGDDTKVEIVVD